MNKITNEQVRVVVEWMLNLNYSTNAAVELPRFSHIKRNTMARFTGNGVCFSTGNATLATAKNVAFVVVSQKIEIILQQ
ncbi:MAG: hypothetical protein PHC99_09635 [Methylococcales bacterium]|nr:hypothetical protein [Methylococcales bacterium]